MEEIIKEVLKEIKNISYGWCDSFGVVHHHAKINYFKENYRTMSLDSIINNKVGTCIEQVYYTRYLLNKRGIDSKSYIIIYNDPSKIARHTICVVNDSNKYYLVENEWNVDGLKVFASINELLESIVNGYPRMYKIDNFNRDLIEIYNYDSYVEGISLDEFTNNCRKAKKIELI